MATANSTHLGNPKTRPVNPEAFEEELKTDLAKGPLVLLGFPEVAMRVQQALAEEFVSTQQLVKLVGAEPVLTSRILCLANSAAMGARHEVVTDLRTAVSRLGIDALRGAVMAHAMALVRASHEFVLIASPLRDLWQTSVVVAALCNVVARRNNHVNAEAAQLVGLLHGVGKLYILTKASGHPELLADASVMRTITEAWHARVARTLLRQWGLPDPIIDAVAGPEQGGPAPAGSEAQLVDVLTYCLAVVKHMQDPGQLGAVLAGLPATTRLGLSAADCQTLISESEEPIAEVLESFGM